MKLRKDKFQTIDEYIGSFPSDIQEKLEKIRMTIKKAAPKSEEVISYQMPAFKSDGILVYFAAFKNHIGFYPTAKVISVFSKELSSYETTKGTVRFPFGERIPLNLIAKITKFRLKEELERKKIKKNK
jgi:uncharacterized protein YdhG (YjbR/CyaY superfamily)